MSRWFICVLISLVSLLANNALFVIFPIVCPMHNHIILLKTRKNLRDLFQLILLQKELIKQEDGEYFAFCLDRQASGIIKSSQGVSFGSLQGAVRK